MVFKTSYADKSKGTKTVATLDTGELSLVEWAELNLTIEQVEHCLWYGVGLEEVKANIKTLIPKDAVEKVKRLYGGAVTLAFDVPIATSDAVAKLVKSDKALVEEALLASGKFVRDARGEIVKLQK